MGGKAQRIPLVALLALLAFAGAARAAGMLDQVRATHLLRCGAVERPGFAEAPPEGAPIGIAVDICRAVAVAVIGPTARISFSIYDSPGMFDGVRKGSEALALLTGGEIAEQDLARFVLPGPTVAITTVSAMVPAASPVRRLADLSDQTVCLMIGNRAQRALESAMAARHLAISRLAFEEDVEMLDAYNAGRCGAAVGETTYLADMRRTPGVRRVVSRLLPELLAADPIVSVTPRTDGAWAAVVSWVIAGLLLADAPSDEWQAGRLPIELRRGWQADVTAAVGSYGAIIRRNLTDRLGLPPGLNALWPEGMLLPPAIR